MSSCFNVILEEIVASRVRLELDYTVNAPTLKPLLHGTRIVVTFKFLNLIFYT